MYLAKTLYNSKGQEDIWEKISIGGQLIFYFLIDKDISQKVNILVDI